MHIVNPPKRFKLAYPLSTFTYAIVPQQSSKAGLLRQFIRYAIGRGQQFGPALDFSPIPALVRNAATRTANGLK